MRLGRQRNTVTEIGPGKRLNEFSGAIRDIGELVLNKKKDIKFHRSAENRTGAARYATQHNLLLGPDEDINGDGINDVVLYKKDGTPVMINGYTFKESETPYRNLFNERHPTKASKMRIGGYSGFMKDFRKDEEALGQFVQALPEGFARKRVYKQRDPSTYQLLSAKIRENLKVGLEMINEELGNNYKWIISRFPYMKAIAWIYLDKVIRVLWNSCGDVKAQIIQASGTSNGRYELFKSQLKTKGGKEFYERMLSSDEFRQALDAYLQPANILGFLRDICRLSDEVITEFGDDVQLQADIDVKAKIMNHFEQLSQHLDETKQITIEQMFGN